MIHSYLVCNQCNKFRICRLSFPNAYCISKQLLYRIYFTLEGTRRVGGLLGVAGRLSGTVSPFRAEQGTSLETPWRARASSCQEVGTTWFFSSCGGILELRRGSQPSPWVGPGKPNLPLELRGKAGGCARVTAGPKRPHLGVCPGPNIPLQGRQGSRGCIPGSPGESGLVSRGSQGLCSPLES